MVVNLLTQMQIGDKDRDRVETGDRRYGRIREMDMTPCVDSLTGMHKGGVNNV